MIAVVLSKITNFAVDIANYELSRQVDYCFGLMPVFWCRYVGIHVFHVISVWINKI